MADALLPHLAAIGIALCVYELLQLDEELQLAAFACSALSILGDGPVLAVPALLDVLLFAKRRLGPSYGVAEARELYAEFVRRPDLFKALTNFTPSAFDALVQRVLDPNRPAAYLLKPRCRGGQQPLARRRQRTGRPHKLSPHTRVFLCLVRLKDDARVAQLCALSGTIVKTFCAHPHAQQGIKR